MNLSKGIFKAVYVGGETQLAYLWIELDVCFVEDSFVQNLRETAMNGIVYIHVLHVQQPKQLLTPGIPSYPYIERVPREK